MIKTSLAALLALPLIAHAGGGMNDVKQQVQVDAAAGKVVVRMTVENNGAKPVFVPKAVFEDDQIFRREFQVKDMATGAEVDYTGPMVKRGPITKDDFLAVKPGKKLSHSIDITRSYDFKPKHTYQLSYQGGYAADLAKVETMSAVSVPAVTFTIGK